jgi:hypothetical protein
MSCYDPFSRNPPLNRQYSDGRSRRTNFCFNEEGAQEKYKAKVLQYRNNSTNLTAKQRYALIATGNWTNRSTTWASQTENYTNPNVLRLDRGNYELIERTSLTNPINNILECTNNENYFTIDHDSLPGKQTKSKDYEVPLIPPRILQPSNNTPIPYPIPIIPQLYTIFIRDGGILICNTNDTICELL